MKLMLDENGNAVLQDGHPVYVYDDGSESPFDAAATLDNLNHKIDNLTEEKDRFFNKSKQLKEDLKKFEGIDIEKAKDAMEKLKMIDDNKLVDEQGVEALKRTMRENFDEELKNVVKSHKQEIVQLKQSANDLQSIIYDLAIKNRFATSPYFSGSEPKSIYPPEDAAKIFGDNFDVKIDGRKFKIVAKDNDGKPILSKKNHGEPAEFDEAVAQLVENHSKKHAILRAQRGGGPNGGGNLNDLSLEKFDSLSPTDKIKCGLAKRGLQ
jgi:hypothetical protein